VSEKRVLVVDDDPAVLEVCARFLQKMGYGVTSAESGTKALNFIRSEPVFDLLLADIIMPQMDGFQLMEAARQIIPDLCVVVITVYGTLDMTIKALRRGADGFLIKPFSEEEFQATVESALNRHQLVRENIRLQSLIPLLEAGRQFLQAKDATELAEHIVRLSKEETHASRVALLLADEVTGVYEVVRAMGFQRGLDRFVEILNTIAPSAVRRRESYLFNLGDAMPSRIRRMMRELGVSSLLVVPFSARGTIKGVLGLLKDQGSPPFRGSDRDFLVILSDQGAAALENVRLLDETRRRLEESATLLMLSQEMVQLTHMDRLLQTIVDSAQRLVPAADKCVIHLLDHKRRMLVPRYSSKPEPETVGRIGIPAGEGIAGLALKRRTTINVHDVNRDSRFLRRPPNVHLRSLLVAPLFVGDNDLGTLSLNSAIPSAFDPDDARLLTTLAGQASVVIEQARLVEQIMAEKRNSEAILRSMGDGLILLDRNHRVLDINPALEQMLGVKKSVLIGRVIEADTADPAMTQLKNIYEASSSEKAEITLNGPVSRTLQAHVSPVLNGSGQLLGEVCVVHDVTRERQLEQMKTQFISNVSHELRTPLFSLRGFIELLRDGKVRDEETKKEFLETMYRKTIQLTKLVDDLLDVSRLESGRFQIDRVLMSISPIIQQVLYEMRTLAREKGVRIQAEVPADLPPIMGDARRLEQVMTNLLDNAVKFTEAGGSVTVRASVTGDEILVEIQDTGIGIPPDALGKLFSRFYQVDASSARRTGGVGLGLYISREIVEAHDGRIWAESKPGVGSTFLFTLPVAQTSKIQERA